MQLLKLPDSEYFATRRYSNSDLTELEKQMFDFEKRPFPADAFRFGSLFHQYVLEGIEPINATEDERQRIERMAEHLNDNKTFWHRWAFGKKETSVFWESEGLPLKCKLDLMLENRGKKTICDLKTTSAKNVVQFYEESIKFNYHRQAAFYLDSVGGQYYEIWAIQKEAPHKIFHLTHAHNSEYIEDGRKAYKRLLKAVHTTQFIPSKWTATQSFF